jgi:hypothetical protein
MQNTTVSLLLRSCLFRRPRDPVAVKTRLQSRCIITDVSSGSIILALSPHVTIQNLRTGNIQMWNTKSFVLPAVTSALGIVTEGLTYA